MSNRYEYEIDEKSKALAMKELNEDPSQVNAHIESLQRWVNSMPHLQCPTDKRFLLMFLRVSKFDHAKAQKRIDNFCTVRTSDRLTGNLFKPYLNYNSTFESFMKMKFFVPLGKVESGETIVLVRYSIWDPHILSYADILGLCIKSFDVLLKKEKIQVHGFILLLDFRGVSKKIVEAVCNPTLMKEIYVIFQDSYPSRFKGQIFYTDSDYFELFFRIIFFFLNDKMKRRTFQLRHNYAKVMELIPGLEKILPKEYNGQGGSLDESADKWNEKVRKFYKEDHPFQSINVDEAKRPVQTLKFLATHKDYKSDIVQSEGTYTKFENVF